MTAPFGAPRELEAHPLRARVLGEVHARPFDSMETPRRLLHFAFMTDHAANAADRKALAAFCASRGLPQPTPGGNHHRVSFSGTHLRWEPHGEFTTYTWEFADDAQSASAFQPPPDRLAGVMALVPQPGPLLVAADLHLLPQPPDGDEATRIFGATNLAAAEVENGLALAATDFKPDPHGFVRILVLDRGLSGAQAGALTQRLLEVETYRTLALLGLPEAQRLAPSVRNIEAELPRLIESMARNEGLEANNALLDKLTGLATELEGGAAASLFRFGATRAYDELVRLRLEAVQERPVPGLPSFSAFLARRMAPAIRTCATLEERQANLSRKLTRAAQLLRTHVDIELERQNRDLLQAMNERARIQLRLQQTVEGLSVAAISYYLVGLGSYVLKGLDRAGLPIHPDVALALLVPAALLMVAWIVRRIRKGHIERAGAD
jgi:uncharacterized membrane-anchored protein